MVVPVMIVLTGLAGALGWDPAEEAFAHANIVKLVSQPLAKLFLFVVVSLPLFHCAHRIRHTLVDFGLGGFETPLAVVCYLGAIAGTILCGFLLWRL